MHRETSHPSALRQNSSQLGRVDYRTQTTTQETPQRKEPAKEQGASSPAVNVASSSLTGLTPILPSCMAWVIGPGETKSIRRIFFNSSSEVTMIRRDLALRLGLDGPCYRLHPLGVGGVQLPSTQEKLVKFRLASLSGDY